MEQKNFDSPSPASITTSPNKYLLPATIAITTLFLASSALAAYFYLQNRNLNSQLNTLRTATSPTPSPSITPDLTPSPTAAGSLTLTPTPPSNVPAGWKTHSFSDVKLTLFAPANWKSDIQYFSNIPSYLIRFWQGQTPDTATIRLNIKNDWANTGDAQYLIKNYTVANSVPAAKVEPPKKEEQTLDRYQTNYYFEHQNKVYIFECVHNWIPAQIEICETMLDTIQFN